MKRKTNTLALLGTLLVFAGFVVWYAVANYPGMFIAGFGLILFAVGAIQESERERS